MWISGKLQRVQIKKMLNQWEKEYPDRVQSIFKSIQKVEISHLLDKIFSILMMLLESV